VQDMEEFFDLHHVPPPFNASILLRLLHNHLTHGTSLMATDKRWGPLLSAADIKKKSKVAQHEFLRKQHAAEARTAQAQLEKLAQLQKASAECLEKLLADSLESGHVLSHIAAVQRDMVSSLTDRHERSDSPSLRSHHLSSPGQSTRRQPHLRNSLSKSSGVAAPPLRKARSGNALLSVG